MPSDSIDLRSDTVTQPTPAMREAMATAIVGDDVYGEDPTVNQLEAQAARLAGMPAAAFMASGTQGNLTALLAHCERGDEYIVGQQAHTYKYEGGGAAVLGSIQPQPLEFDDDATLDLERVADAIKPDDPHFARTRLMCLENTHNGRIVPLAYLERARQFTREHALQLHLDGARVFNAAVALDVSLQRITEHVDSVSICLSKGLGAPAGTVLCGSSELIDKARRWRKVVGGGMRQAGIIAAAGLHAFDQHIDRLREDHANAKRLADGLATLPGLEIDTNAVQTNMVFVFDSSHRIDLLHDHLQARGIRISRRNPLRLVTHLDVTEQQIDDTVEAFAAFYQRANATVA